MNLSAALPVVALEEFGRHPRWAHAFAWTDHATAFSRLGMCSEIDSSGM
jgi:hypothetical protein